MGKLYSFLIILVALISITNCRNGSSTKEYYVISTHDSLLNVAYNNLDNSTDTRPPLPNPPLPATYKMYANLVIVFDSTNKVYLYQTELIYKDRCNTVIIDSANANSINEKCNSDNARGESENHQQFKEPDYPFFLGLRPEHLLAFDEQTFIPFIQYNNDLFKLDTNFNKYKRFFIIASAADTIKNPAFYSFMQQIKSKQKGMIFIVRHISEEEAMVIHCKAYEIAYEPQNYHWTSNFLYGSCKPMTEAYKKAELNCPFVRKAKETFYPDCTKAIAID